MPFTFLKDGLPGFSLSNFPRKLAKRTQFREKALCLTVIKTQAYCGRMLMKQETYGLRFIALEHF